MTQLQDLASVQAAVREAVETVTISDIHTHLFYPSHGDLLLWGVDELLTYHYLVAELFTIAPADLTYEKFWAMSKTEQADLIWQKVFIETGALSEACRGVITTLNRLGLDTAGRDLNSIRKWFADQDEEDYLHRVFELANLDWAIMTNNPFEPEEAGYWKQDRPKNDLLKAALRIDNLILDWENASKTMADQGYDTAEPNDKSFAQARRFLADWAKVIDPVYMAASLPPEFAYPDGGLPARIIKQVVMPTAKELNLPMAMMIGVRKRVNPPLGDAGDAVGIADVTAVNSLCIENPDAKFLVTMLSRV
ncbi:MAG: glucuronate isomerase, partial [Planctomycetota bacterium]